MTENYATSMTNQDNKPYISTDFFKEHNWSLREKSDILGQENFKDTLRVSYFNFINLLAFRETYLEILNTVFTTDLVLLAQL